MNHFYHFMISNQLYSKQGTEYEGRAILLGDMHGFVAQGFTFPVHKYHKWALITFIKESVICNWLSNEPCYWEKNLHWFLEKLYKSSLKTKPNKDYSPPARPPRCQEQPDPSCPGMWAPAPAPLSPPALRGQTDTLLSHPAMWLTHGSVP